jgi:DNA replication protein DnaD
LIAEELRAAERDFPITWIEDAIRIAVKRNARNWRYVEAILRSWQEKGRDEEDRRKSEKDSRRYIEGEFGDFIKH